MSKASVFTIVEVGHYVIPILIFLILHFIPKALSQKYRIVFGIFISWVLLIFYTIYIYNPAGIAAGHELGMHFPEGKYDNNRTSLAIFIGWMYPTFLALVYLAFINKWKKSRNQI